MVATHSEHDLLRRLRSALLAAAVVVTAVVGCGGGDGGGGGGDAMSIGLVSDTGGIDDRGFPEGFAAQMVYPFRQ